MEHLQTAAFVKLPCVYFSALAGAWPVLWLTHWGRVTHICVGNLTIIGSDNGLSPDRRQAIIWANAGILLFGPLGTNFNEILIAILTFSFKKMRLKVSSAKRQPFCLGLNVLSSWWHKPPRYTSYHWGMTSQHSGYTWQVLFLHSIILASCLLTQTASKIHTAESDDFTPSRG